MKKATVLSLVITVIFSLQPATFSFAAQDPAPNPGTPLQRLETKLEATETFDPQANLNRVSLDFRAAISLGQNGSIDPLFDNLLIQYQFPSDPCKIVFFIPGGCFSQRGNGYRVRNPQECGVSISVEFLPESNQQPVDLTPGLIDFDARLTPASEGGGLWNLRIELSFLDIRQHPQPRFLTILGGSDGTIVQIGDDIGRTTPRSLEVIGSSQ